MAIDLWRTRPYSSMNTPLRQWVDRVFDEAYTRDAQGNGSAGFQSLPVNVWETPEGYQAGLLAPGIPIVVDVKTGSSEAGASVNPGTHHPEKSHSVRAYAPTGHRHTAEIVQETGLDNVALSVTAVEDGGVEPELLPHAADVRASVSTTGMRRVIDPRDPRQASADS